jgi:transcriptional regulator with XRE-family HTH domain
MDAPPIGRRLKAARRLAGLTVPELAAALALPGLGAKTLGAIERGEREMRPHEIAPIADITGMPISYFAAKTGEPLWPEPAGLGQGVEERLARMEDRFDAHARNVERLLAAQTGVLASIKNAQRQASETITEASEVWAARLSETSARILEEAERAARSRESARDRRAKPRSQ